MAYMTPFERHKHEEDKEKMESRAINEQQPRRIPWADEVFAKMYSNRSKECSPLMNWYFQEKAKLEKRLFNEIDANEIRNAKKGFTNSWTKAVKENPENFKYFDKHDFVPSKEEWETIRNSK